LAHSGTGRKKAPRFFEELDSFLGDQPQAIGIVGAIDTLDERQKPNTHEPTRLEQGNALYID
jgi:hypothetical protein